MQIVNTHVFLYADANTMLYAKQQCIDCIEIWV